MVTRSQDLKEFCPHAMWGPWPAQSSDCEGAGVLADVVCPSLARHICFLHQRMLTSCAGHTLPDAADHAAKVTLSTCPLQLKGTWEPPQSYFPATVGSQLPRSLLQTGCS